MENKRIYNIYMHMIYRTEKPSNKDYKNYGAKGIRVCEEWRNSSEVFIDWALKNGYEKDLTIDRIDNSKGYTPENCRWVTKAEQNANKTTATFVFYNGEKISIPELSRRTGIKRRLLYNRIIRCGWDADRAIAENVHTVNKNVTYMGKTQSVYKWALEFNIPYSTLKRRLCKGWDIETALKAG